MTTPDRPSWRLCRWHWVVVQPDYRQRCPVCSQSVEQHHPPYTPKPENEVMRGSPFAGPP
jgi:hypothetical protein